MSRDRLGIGIIGSGFNARFHLQAFTRVRDADIRGIWSPNPPNAKDAVAAARNLEVGETRAYSSIREMVADPAIDAIWLCGPNHARIANVEEIVAAIPLFQIRDCHLDVQEIALCRRQRSYCRITKLDIIPGFEQSRRLGLDRDGRRKAHSRSACRPDSLRRCRGRRNGFGKACRNRYGYCRQ